MCSAVSYDTHAFLKGLQSVREMLFSNCQVRLTSLRLFHSLLRDGAREKKKPPHERFSFFFFFSFFIAGLFSTSFESHASPRERMSVSCFLDTFDLEAPCFVLTLFRGSVFWNF